MLIFFPIGHKDLIVQRLPYVTIVIIILNVLIFMFTGFSESKLEKIYMEKLETIIDFYSMHTDIDIDEIIKDENQTLSSILQEVKNRYSYLQGKVSSSALDKNRLIQLIDEFNQIILSLPSRKYGLIPNQPKLFNYFSSMFMHGGFFHLLFNMIFLWIAGCSIEDKWGRPLYLGFYLFSGVVASYAHVVMFPASAIPMVGASGAIAGAMGAFLIRMHKTKIRIFYAIWLFLFYMHSGTFYIPAYVALPFWFLQQVYSALSSTNSNSAGGVAFWAHIGGFIFGVAMALIIKKFNIEEKYIQPNIEGKISIKQHPKLLSAIEKFDQENYEESLSNIDECLRMEPNHLDANNLLVQVYLKQNKKSDAALVYKKIASIYLSERNNELALTNYMDMKNLSSDVSLSPRDQMNIANLLEKNGQILEAADAYERLINQYPSANEKMKASVMAGDFYLAKLNQPDRALNILMKAKEGCEFFPEWKDKIEEGIKKAFDLVNQKQDQGQTDTSQKSIQKPSETGLHEKRTASVGIMDKRVIAFEMNITRLYQNGMMLEGDNYKELFKWEQIKYVSIGDIDSKNPHHESPIIIDLIYTVAPENIKLFRIQEKKIDYGLLFDNNSQNDRNKDFQMLLSIILKYSRAQIIPASENKNMQEATLVIPKFPSLKGYESSIISSLS